MAGNQDRSARVTPDAGKQTETDAGAQEEPGSGSRPDALDPEVVTSDDQLEADGSPSSSADGDGVGADVRGDGASEPDADANSSGPELSEEEALSEAEDSPRDLAGNDGDGAGEDADGTPAAGTPPADDSPAGEEEASDAEAAGEGDGGDDDAGVVGESGGGSGADTHGAGVGESGDGPSDGAGEVVAAGDESSDVGDSVSGEESAGGAESESVESVSAPSEAETAAEGLTVEDADGPLQDVVLPGVLDADGGDGNETDDGRGDGDEAVTDAAGDDAVIDGDEAVDVDDSDPGDVDIDDAVAGDTVTDEAVADRDGAVSADEAIADRAVGGDDVDGSVSDGVVADDAVSGDVETPTVRQLALDHVRRSLRLRDYLDGTRRLTPEVVLVLASVVTVALLVVIVVGWAVDSVVHAGQVHRNVALAGQAVGGKSEEDLASVVADVGDQVDERTVTVVVDGATIDEQVTASALGLALDESAAVDASMDAGRSGLLPIRPFNWFGSLLTDRSASPEYDVDQAAMTDTLGRIYQDGVDDVVEVVPARNPGVVLADGRFVLVPGRSGTGLDLDRAASDLVTAAGGTDDPFGEIVMDIETSELVPSIPDREAQALVDEANTLTEEGLTVVAEDIERSFSAEQLRSWITPIVDPSDPAATEGIDPDEVDDLEELSLHFDTAAAEEAVAELFPELDEKPVDATVKLSGGKMAIVDSQTGTVCCKGDVGELVWSALDDGEPALELEAEVAEPKYTTEDVESWGIVEPVAGSRGWRSGAEVAGPRPGYTTWEVGSGGRAHNIETMASEINGAVIPPGETWSINDHVGTRECPPYQQGGAIVDGEHETVCGGGTSQVATTLLNAAYFAGLDVTGQAHSEYFSRYPRGREATMGAPGTPLDVTIENTTPYGIYIQGARHGNEITFTIWSTQHIKVEDLGTTGAGTCVTVTNTRQRTFPDGSVETDEFTAYYRPGEGQFC